MNPIYRTQAWRAVRKRALIRDGYECKIRLPGCMGRATAADHVVELEDGGPPYALENLQAACRSCNTSKRNTALARRAREATPPEGGWGPDWSPTARPGYRTSQVW